MSRYKHKIVPRCTNFDGPSRCIFPAGHQGAPATCRGMWRPESRYDLVLVSSANSVMIRVK